MGRRRRSSGIERRGVGLVEFPHRDHRVPYVVAPGMGFVDEVVPDEQPREHERQRVRLDPVPVGGLTGEPRRDEFGQLVRVRDAGVIRLDVEPQLVGYPAQCQRLPAPWPTAGVQVYAPPGSSWVVSGG